MTSVRCPVTFASTPPCCVQRLPFHSALQALKSQRLPILQARRPFRPRNPVRIRSRLPRRRSPERGISGLPLCRATPAPNGSGGGQYDNRSHGGGGGSGIMSHLTYEFGGGGFNAPTAIPPLTSPGAETSRWAAVIASTRTSSLMLEYQFIDDKLPGAIIAEAGATGGNDHIWSLTLDPVYDFNPKSAINFYVTGGYGFYRKVTSFTDPEQQQYCTYFYCGVVTQNVMVGHFSSNQGGWNIGGGLSHRFAGWNGDGKMSIFAEARYLDVLSPAVTTQPNGLGTTSCRRRYEDHSGHDRVALLKRLTSQPVLAVKGRPIEQAATGRLFTFILICDARYQRMPSTRSRTIHRPALPTA